MDAAVVISVAVVGYALVSKRLAATPITAAIVFTGLGILLGPAALGVVRGPADRSVVTAVLEATLALVLFTDSLAISGSNWRVASRLPTRLLLIGMPLTMVVGLLVARGVFGSIEPFEAALLAICLAPTDAALGQAVVSDPRVPGLIRDALNVESGLNDGLALPFFLVVLAGAVAADVGDPGPAEVFVRSLLGAAAIGGLLGAAGGWALGRSRRAGWISEAWGQIAVLALVVGVYLGADAAGGSGFIAAWVAGVAFGRTIGGGFPAVSVLAEDLGALLGTISFLGFGAILLGPVLGALTWSDLAYAVLSLTVIRMIPVALSLIGTRLARPTTLYIGWFGPRGLASIVFGLLLAEEALPHGDAIVRTIYCTVLLSVILHGATAVWGARRYAGWFRRASGSDPSIAEAVLVESPVVRRRVLAPGAGPPADVP
jgi:NhaP-type Na+/H+ or K+/H+ antiporter